MISFRADGRHTPAQRSIAPDRSCRGVEERRFIFVALSSTSMRRPRTKTEPSRNAPSTPAAALTRLMPPATVRRRDDDDDDEDDDDDDENAGVLVAERAWGSPASFFTIAVAAVLFGAPVALIDGV